MAVYERLSGDKKWPPESRKCRKELQFGRYDYHVDPESPPADGSQPPKRSAADVEAIVDRLRQEIRRDDARQLEAEQLRQQRHGHRTVSEAEASEIFDRLRQCDYGRWPVESRVGRRELGQNRYDFYRGSAPAGSEATPKVSKEELDTIIGRLSTYDVNKTPPNSRALEIKQMKANGPA